MLVKECAFTSENLSLNEIENIVKGYQEDYKDKDFEININEGDGVNSLSLWLDDGDKCADADFIVQMNNDNNSLMNIKSLKNKIENTNVWGEVNVMMEQVEDKINDGEEILDIDFYCYGK